MLYRYCQYIGEERKLEYQPKNTDVPELTYTLDHIYYIGYGAVIAVIDTTLCDKDCQ